MLSVAHLLIAMVKTASAAEASHHGEALATLLKITKHEHHVAIAPVEELRSRRCHGDNDARVLRIPTVLPGAAPALARDAFASLPG